MQQAPFIALAQNNRQFILTRLPASVVTKISYAAVRGQSKEDGAIQRVLNTSRISSIKDFTLQGGDYPNAIILNWVSTTNVIERAVGTVSFEDLADSAQIIDGQHRVAGIRAAIEESAGIGKLELPVVIYEKLSTKECADIFLAINTEQKPAPRSLVFDLYGIASSALVDSAAVRARDIAIFLNEEETSPYAGSVKFPGSPKRRGGIALSTAVTAIKPLVEEKQGLEQVGLKELETQRLVILNLAKALQGKYGEAWYENSNTFLYGSGFMGAMEFLKSKLIQYCVSESSFKTETMDKVLDLPRDKLIRQTEIRGLGGREAVNRVVDRLNDAFRPSKPAVKYEL